MKTKQIEKLKVDLQGLRELLCEHYCNAITKNQKQKDEMMIGELGYREMALHKIHCNGQQTPLGYILAVLTGTPDKAYGMLQLTRPYSVANDEAQGELTICGGGKINDFTLIGLGEVHDVSNITPTNKQRMARDALSDELVID